MLKENRLFLNVVRLKFVDVFLAAGELATKLLRDRMLPDKQSLL